MDPITSLKSLDDSIKLCLMADNALDTEAVSDIDSNRAKMPGGDLEDDGDKCIVSNSSAISSKSFSSTRKRHCSSSHGSPAIEDTLCDDAPASNDPHVPKTKLIATDELSTCLEETKACKEHYAQMAIPDCNVAIPPDVCWIVCALISFHRTTGLYR
uniref:Uncharacterized protein n=1 Tax=Romanomermis culicivorax TaxID=13658 RepID=A0A915HH45_ROMCU